MHWKGNGVKWGETTSHRWVSISSTVVCCLNILQNKYSGLYRLRKRDHSAIDQAIASSKLSMMDGYWTDIGNFILSSKPRTSASPMRFPISISSITTVLFSPAHVCCSPAKVSSTLEKTRIAEGTIINASRMEADR